MGNNNSSGVNEEGEASGVQQKPSQKETLADSLNQENHKISMDESNNNLELDAGLTSSQKESLHEDACEDKAQEPKKSLKSQLENTLMVQSDQKEDSIKQESEKSSMAAVELAETGLENSESLAVSSPKDIEDIEKPREVHLEKISLVTSDDQIDKEVSMTQGLDINFMLSFINNFSSLEDADLLDYPVESNKKISEFLENCTAICEEIKMIQNPHDTFCNETTQKDSKTNITYAEKYKYLSYDSCKESESVVGTSIFIGISQDNQAVEGKAANNQNQERRVSCVSKSENLNIYFQKQKTPSFDFDLRIKASPKEFDQTPLLNQNKTHAENLSRQCDIVHLSLNSQAEYSQAQLQYTSVSREEKLVTSEKKYSVTSQAPMIDLSNENEKIDAQATANKSEKQVTVSPPKAKEKRKHKSSLFSNFMCCATVIN